MTTVAFHTTRHTATTAMIETGFDIATVQAQTGHSDKTMLKRYAHAMTRSRCDAAAALDQFTPPAAEPPEKASAFSATVGSNMREMQRMPHTQADKRKGESR